MLVRFENTQGVDLYKRKPHRCLIFLLLWLGSIGSIAQAQSKAQSHAKVQAQVTAEAANIKPLMQVKKIDPQVFYVQGVSEMGSSANQNFISNAGFVVTPAGVVVVDALGSPELARRLLAEIRKITKKRIHTVVLTHYHADHIYGLQVFKEAGARIVAHTAAREYLFSDTAKLRLSLSSRVVAVDR